MKNMGSTTMCAFIPVLFDPSVSPYLPAYLVYLLV